MNKILMRSKSTQLQMKAINQRMKISRSNSTNNHKEFSIDDNHVNDSILSHISFHGLVNILTIARMGSFYYCVEDLYSKAFASLCTFEDFIYLLEKADGNLLKNVTLSEKISIEQQHPDLKKINSSRYQLLTISSFEYLSKIKYLLEKYSKPIDQIANDLAMMKNIPASNILASNGKKVH